MDIFISFSVIFNNDLFNLFLIFELTFLTFDCYKFYKLINK